VSRHNARNERVQRAAHCRKVLCSGTQDGGNKRVDLAPSSDDWERWGGDPGGDSRHPLAERKQSSGVGLKIDRGDAAIVLSVIVKPNGCGHA